MEFRQALEQFLLMNQFQKMNDKGKEIWVRPQDSGISIVRVIYEALPGQNKVLLSEEIRMMEQCQKEWMIRYTKPADVLCLVVRKSNPSSAEVSQIQGCSFVWFLDVEDGRLLIYENQRTDYQGMRSRLETFLENYRGSSNTQKRMEISQTFTPVNTVLVLMNMIIYGILAFGGDMASASYIERWGGMSWESVVRDHQYYRIFLSMFLHFGPEHLLQNMLILTVTGSRLERIIGKGRYLLVYLFSGCTAAWASLMFTLAGSHDIAAGASGAIFGVMGALLVLILEDLGRGQRKRVREIGPVGILFMIGSALYFGFTATGVDNAAHIGGLIGGMILMGILSLFMNQKSDNG